MNKLKLTQNKCVDGSIKHNDQIIGVELRDKNNKKKNVWVHSYLVGLSMASYHNRVILKNAGLTLVVGSVGTGKSTIAQTMAAIDAQLSNTKLNWNHMHWKTDTFCENYQNLDYKGQPILFDESIDSIGSVNTTKEGKRLRKTLITQRFMQRQAYLLVDRMEEYNKRLIFMCNVLVRVRKRGMNRGLADIYTNKQHIEFIYKGFKEYNLNWNSKLIKDIRPDATIKFFDYSNTFYDESEYDKKKSESTQEVEEEKDTYWNPIKLQAYTMFIQGKRNIDIQNTLDKSSSTISDWVKQFRKLDTRTLSNTTKVSEQ